MTNKELAYRFEAVRQQLNASIKICRSSDFEQIATDGGLFVHDDRSLINMVMVTTDYDYQSINCTLGALTVEGWLVFVTRPVKDTLELMSKLIGTTQLLYEGQLEISTCLTELPAELAVESAYNVSTISLRVTLRSDLLEPNCYTICYE